MDRRGNLDGKGWLTTDSDIGDAAMPVSILDSRGGGGVAAETLWILR